VPRRRRTYARSNDLVADAESHAEAVRSALASARDGREARLRQAVEGGDVIERPPSTSQARFALDDAEAELEIARKVLATTAASLGFAIDAQAWAQRKVEAAGTPILTAEIDRVVIETTRLSDEIHRKHEVLIWLRSLLLPDGDERLRTPHCASRRDSIRAPG
jgi:hypothetical protein